MYLSLNSQLSELRAEQERCVKLVDGLLKAMDIQSFRVELERQGKLIERLDKESNIENKDQVDKEADIKSIRAELDQHKTLIDGLVKELDKHSSCFNQQSCKEAKTSGIYELILPKLNSQPIKVVCDAATRQGGWTIILRRMDGSVDFYRNWTEYKTGFGDMDGEFFLGLDKIHALTADRKHELLVILEDFEGDERFETYDEFAIGNEDQQYELHTLGKANGTAGDSLSYQRGMKFSTFDRDNDSWQRGNCAQHCTAAWWYSDCRRQLTGKYNDNNFCKGVNWDDFRGGEYSLKRAIMMIRPKM
ncbi:hypothetical protein ACLKA6_013672 [Drosophila palustris]